MIETGKYTRRPFVVEAANVTAENMEEIALWCKGVVVSADDGAYVKVEVENPIGERQTRAYAEDWVLYAGTGFKVYKDRAFHKTFVKADPNAKVEVPRRPIARLTKAQADNAGIHPPREGK